MKGRQAEGRLAGVREKAAKQAGDIRGRWNWVEPSVWTERMLTAKGGKWFSHNCWTSAYFAEQGLFSLAAAFARACQSSRR